jgi:hypothetical protein
MDIKPIGKDGFSNPKTQRLFDQHWDQELILAGYESRKNCAWCGYGLFLSDNPGEFEWVLCLSQMSPFCMETVNAGFGCPYARPIRLPHELNSTPAGWAHLPDAARMSSAPDSR